MKKLTGVICLFLITTMLILTTGCGQAQAPVDVDIESMTSEIINSGAYTDSMGSTKLATVLAQYGLNEADVADCSVYFSSMATAEECAVFKASGSEAAKNILTACENRKASQTTSYESYVPSEVSKLDAAIVMQSGDYVMYIVSNDQPTVSNILTNYGFLNASK